MKNIFKIVLATLLLSISASASALDLLVVVGGAHSSSNTAFKYNQEASEHFLRYLGRQWPGVFTVTVVLPVNESVSLTADTACGPAPAAFGVGAKYCLDLKPYTPEVLASAANTFFMVAYFGNQMQGGEFNFGGVDVNPCDIKVPFIAQGIIPNPPPCSGNWKAVVNDDNLKFPFKWDSRLLRGVQTFIDQNGDGSFNTTRDKFRGGFQGALFPTNH